MTRVEKLIQDLAKAATTPPPLRDQVVYTPEQVRSLATAYQNLCWRAADAFRQIYH